VPIGGRDGVQPARDHRGTACGHAGSCAQREHGLDVRFVLFVRGSLPGRDPLYGYHVRTQTARAGKEARAYYRVYLKGYSESSYYQDNIFDRIVDSGYISAGDTIVNTSDFQGPSGYQQLCIMVNGQEECGFKQVSTSFAINYVKDMYMAEQASQTNIKTEEECISGISSLYSFALSGNIQSGGEEALNPQIYDRGIKRICATKDPGVGTDPLAGSEGARWVKVGYCDNTNIGCWQDQESVENVITASNIEESVIGETSDNFLNQLFEEGDYYKSQQDFEGELEKVVGPTSESTTDSEKINILNNMLEKSFWNNQKALVIYLKGTIYSKLAVKSYAD